MGSRHPKTIAFTTLLLFSVIILVNLQLCYGQIEPYYYLGCYAEQNALLKETTLAKIPQTCVEFCEVKSANYAIMAFDKCSCSNVILLENKQNNTLCTYRCKSNQLEYCGGVEMLSYYTTKWALDASPINLRLLNATENTLSLSWVTKQPYKPFYASADNPLPLLKIINYIIKANIIHTYSSLQLYSQPEFSIQHDQDTIELTDLYPATEYNITVTTLCQTEYSKITTINCGISYLNARTLVGKPYPPPAQPIILEADNSTITIEIHPIRNDNGPVSKVLIIVERINDIIMHSFQENLLGSWEQAEEQGISYYIAAELDYTKPNSNCIRQFIVGDGKHYGRYINPPLHLSPAKVFISLGVVSTLNGVTRTLYTSNTHLNEGYTNNKKSDESMNNFQYSTFEPGQQSLIALIASCTIFGICFIISLMTYIYLRYKTNQLRAIRNRSQSHSHEMTMQQPIVSREYNGYLADDEIPTTEGFKEQLSTVLDSLKSNKRLPRKRLRINVNDILADGNYGEVVSGKIILTKTDADEDGINCQLHVIDLDDLPSVDQAKLLREFSNVVKVEQHPNILDFYGVSASSNWFYISFEYHNITLKQRLLDSRIIQSQQESHNSRCTTLSEQLILQWIYEIASAMEYLIKLKVSRVCLCSHNIYVTPDTKLKLTIFGPIPYASREVKRKVNPTRWLAPEVLRYQSYTLKSEVWSFAIVAWECCTLGATPYNDLHNTEQLLEALKSGYRPQQPYNVFNDIYQMFLNCWSLESSERPNFDDLCYNVRQLMTSPRHALCFDYQRDQLLPFYMPLLESQT